MFFSRFGDAIASGIERVTGWRPGIRTKIGLEWTGAVTGAVLGVCGIAGALIARARG